MTKGGKRPMLKSFGEISDKKAEVNYFYCDFIDYSIYLGLFGNE